MYSERKLTEREHAILVEQAKSLSEAVRRHEITVDEQVPEIIAKYRNLKEPFYTIKSKRNTGLTFSTQVLEGLCLEFECLSYDECRNLPLLIRSIRDLLIYQYDIIQNWEDSNVFTEVPIMYPKEYAEVAVRLHVVGTFLRLHPTRLFTIMSRSGGDMSDIMFNETMGLSDLHAASAEELRLLHSSRNCQVRSTGPVNSSLQTLALCHRASVKYLLLVSQLWMCVAQRSPNETHRQLAWNRIIEFSTQNIEIRAFADTMSFVLQPKVLQPVLDTFLMNNGIQSLVFSWIANHGSGIYNVRIPMLEHIDLAVWECQSKESIWRIMDILVIKMETYSLPDDVEAKRDSRHIDDLSSTPLFKDILHKIYSVFGLEPFHYAAKRARSSVLFPFLLCRIGRHPERYWDREQFGRLVDKCRGLSTASVDRYMWVRCEYRTRKYFLEGCSCDNARCPYKRRYREWFRSWSVLTEEQEQELDEWGMKMKICAGCRAVIYCCKDCRRQGWPGHKNYCLKGQEYTEPRAAPKEKLTT